MTSIEKVFCQRQYDRSIELVKAVTILTLMPDEIRSIISEVVLGLTRQEFDDVTASRRYRTLGSEKVLSLYMAQKRRRAYDQNPILHKAINRLYLLSGATQDFVGQHILAMSDFIQRYLDSCGELQQEASVEHVAEITQNYIEKGSTEAEALLKKLRQEFYLKLFGHAEDSEEVPAQNAQPVDINSNQKGMKINRFDFD